MVQCSNWMVTYYLPAQAYSITTALSCHNRLLCNRQLGTGGCNNSGGRVKVTVTVNAKPTVPTVASSSVSVCTGSPAVLTVTNPQTGVIL